MIHILHLHFTIVTLSQHSPSHPITTVRSTKHTKFPSLRIVKKRWTFRVIVVNILGKGFKEVKIFIDHLWREIEADREIINDLYQHSHFRRATPISPPYLNNTWIAKGTPIWGNMEQCLQLLLQLSCLAIVATAELPTHRDNSDKK